MTTSKQKYDKTKYAAYQAIGRFETYAFIFLGIAILLLVIVILDFSFGPPLIILVFHIFNNGILWSLNSAVVIYICTLIVFICCFVPFIAG